MYRRLVFGEFSDKRRSSTIVRRIVMKKKIYINLNNLNDTHGENRSAPGRIQNTRRKNIFNVTIILLHVLLCACLHWERTGRTGPRRHVNAFRPHDRRRPPPPTAAAQRSDARVSRPPRPTSLITTCLPAVTCFTAAAAAATAALVRLRSTVRSSPNAYTKHNGFGKHSAVVIASGHR